MKSAVNPFKDGIERDTKVVIVTTHPGEELKVGDTGVVRAAWLRANVLVCWDKDNGLRMINRKRLKRVDSQKEPES